MTALAWVATGAVWAALIGAACLDAWCDWRDERHDRGAR